MQAVVTRNGEIIGRMELQEDLSLIDVAQSIFNFLPLSPTHAVGSQSMVLAFYTHDDVPAATVIMPNDTMFEQFRGLTIRDLPNLYQIIGRERTPPREILTIKMEPLRTGLSFFIPHLERFPTPPPTSPTRIQTPPMPVPTQIQTPPMPVPTQIQTPPMPTSPTRIQTPPTQVQLQNQWIITRDLAGTYRLLDESVPLRRPTGKVRLGSRYDSYKRDTLVEIVRRNHIYTHQVNMEQTLRYNQVILRGSKGDLFEILKEILPIRDLDV
jgi:hypothetical protein